MGILRNEIKSNFTQIPNQLLFDNRLSFGAKILFCYLASKPPNWKVINADIKKTLKISKETIAKYFKELIAYGWIDREKKKNKEGQFYGGYEYTLNLTNQNDIKKDTINPNNKIPIIEEYLDCNKKWDKSLGVEERISILKNISKKHKKEITERIKLMSYKDFLNTPYWKAISAYLKITRGKCEKCGNDTELHIHHKTYVHHGKEIFNLNDLICLCKECHSKFHNKGE